MRFKVDENFPVEASTQLRNAGADVMTVGEQRMSGVCDGILAEVCRREGRGLVTLDLDFADIRTYPPADYIGLIVIRASTQSKAHVLALVARVAEQLQRESASGNLWMVDESGIRIREGT